MLITAAEVADTLGVSASDSVLVRLVKSTDTWAKRKLGRQFERTTYILQPRGHGGDTIWLRESPIRQITEIRIDPLGNFGPDTVVADLSPFAFNPDPFDDDSKITYMGRGWWGSTSALGRWRWPFPEMSNAIRVTVEAGWWAADDMAHTSDLPEDLREKLIERVCAKYKQGADEEVKDERQGDRSTAKFAETDARILRDLQHYKR